MPDHERDVDPVVDPPGGSTTGVAAATTAPGRQRLPWWGEAGLVLVLAVVLAVLIKTYLLQAFYIPSESMEPGLVTSDRIVVEKPSYWSGGPERGDVVVFSDPGGWLADATDEPSGPVVSALTALGLYPTGDHLVKRVIGVAGDTVVCCDGQGRITVNGTALREKGYARLDGADCYGPMTGTCDWTAGPVPAGSLFVMGDNRFHSDDSSKQMCTAAVTDCVPGREFVPTDLVVGKVAAVIWPLDHLRRLGRPGTFADVPAPS